ncbi:Uncharacterized protein Rs2_29031 [Raphanus sativus]|nr:Uncharacterized protein Rs2_29031 [Raphanus sativus]
MKDARKSYGRQGETEDRYNWNTGGKERKNSHHTARYAPYAKNKVQVWKAKEKTEVKYGGYEKRDESYAQRFRSVEGVSNHDAIRSNDATRPRRDEIRVQEHYSTQQVTQCAGNETMTLAPHQSSGKRIASKVVTPSRHDQELDVHVTKRRHVSPRLLTFSPTEKGSLENEQIIGALSDMEIVEQGNLDEESHDTKMDVDDHDDDLLGEELMEIEASKMNGNKDEVVKEDKVTRRPRGSLSN